MALPCCVLAENLYQTCLNVAQPRGELVIWLSNPESTRVELFDRVVGPSRPGGVSGHSHAQAALFH